MENREEIASEGIDGWAGRLGVRDAKVAVESCLGSEEML